MATEEDQNDRTQPLHSEKSSSDEKKVRRLGLYVGMKLVGRYLIERELGRGGIGVVYIARDKNLHLRPVVIKVLLEESGRDIWFEKKFHQEIEALARIDHPGVVGVIDAGETPDHMPFVVMQLVKGKTLRSEMEKGRMSLNRVAHIMRQVGQALYAAHDDGIIHCDLKPENIMLQDLGQGDEFAKILDFGIAKVKKSQVSSDTDATRVAGTIPYMAPEQLLGKPSQASDIYALGVIAYEMITGQRPFRPDSPYELLELQRAGVKEKPRELRPELNEAAQDVILKALSYEPENRHQQAHVFGQALSEALIGRAEPVPAPSPKQVVLLYEQNSEADHQVLKLLEAQLSAAGYKVFIGPHVPPGVEWAREIEAHLRTADAIIVLISAVSIHSETLAYEVELAYEAAQKQQGRPRLLYVRVLFNEPLPDPFLAFFSSSQETSWEGPQDDRKLVEQLLDQLRSRHEAPSESWRLDFLARSAPFEPAYGAVPLGSRFYIVRPTDHKLYDAIARRESIVLIKGARQMGKTSLLARGLQQAREAKARVVLTDFQKLNASNLDSIESLFLTLAELIADQLQIDALPDQNWDPRRGPSLNFERYLRRYVLGATSLPLVWGLDEVDRLATYSYGSEVFGLFRSWHNDRSLDPTCPWHQLTMVIGYATEAYLFITDPNQSPFNVGTRLVLEDFNSEQVADLNQRYGSPLKNDEELKRFYDLLSGHPYLVRMGLHEMATQRTSLGDFEASAERDEGPLGNHLRRILILLAKDPALTKVMKGVLESSSCPSDMDFYRLRSAGIVSGDYARDAKPRCRLYADYLRRHLL